jgi:hypothetical protein
MLYSFCTMECASLCKRSAVNLTKLEPIARNSRRSEAGIVEARNICNAFIVDKAELKLVSPRCYTLQDDNI